MASLTAIMDALAQQIDDQIGSRGTADALIENLQVEPRLVMNPTAPAIDVYPADPFQQALTFGANKEMFFTVRARVSPAEHEGAQDLLLSMMDPAATTSVSRAIVVDKTLSSTIQRLLVTGPSAFGVFLDASGSGSLLGCTWTVQVYP